MARQRVAVDFDDRAIAFAPQEQPRRIGTALRLALARLDRLVGRPL